MKAAAVLTIVALLAAGCTTASPAAAPPSSAPPTGSVVVPPDDNTAETGVVSGRVIDDESRPVPNATVAILSLNVQVTTSADGLFKFEGVPVGKHVFSAAALGFESQSRAVEVSGDENAALVFTLEPIAILEPRYISLPHTFFIHLGAYGTSFAGGDTPSCEKCEWIPKFESGPTHAILEVRGKHTVPHPTRPDGLALFLYKNGHTTAFSTCNWIGTTPAVPCLYLPMRREFNHTALLEAPPADKAVTTIRVWQWCDPFWFCIEERYDEWLTLFYETPEEAVPKEFSAWPK